MNKNIHYYYKPDIIVKFLRDFIKSWWELSDKEGIIFRSHIDIISDTIKHIAKYVKTDIWFIAEKKLNKYIIIVFNDKKINQIIPNKAKSELDLLLIQKNMLPLYLFQEKIETKYPLLSFLKAKGLIICYEEFTDASYVIGIGHTNRFVDHYVTSEKLLVQYFLDLPRIALFTHDMEESYNEFNEAKNINIKKISAERIIKGYFLLQNIKIRKNERDTYLHNNINIPVELCFSGNKLDLVISEYFRILLWDIPKLPNKGKVHWVNLLNKIFPPIKDSIIKFNLIDKNNNNSSIILSLNCKYSLKELNNIYQTILDNLSFIQFYTIKSKTDDYNKIKDEYIKSIATINNYCRFP